MATKQFLGHLAGLRGLAIIFVVLFHLNGQFWAHGYLGVDIFLVITGYLLFRARAMHTGRENWKDFFKFLSKRFCRIVPPMAIHTRPKKIISWAGSGINSEIARMWSFLYPLMSY